MLEVYRRKKEGTGLFLICILHPHFSYMFTVLLSSAKMQVWYGLQCVLGCVG